MKFGNPTHLLEPGWHYKLRYRLGADLQRHPLDRTDARRKCPAPTSTAIAGELASWCWSLAVPIPEIPFLVMHPVASAVVNSAGGKIGSSLRGVYLASLSPSDQVKRASYLADESRGGDGSAWE
ncbi:hypothetical protein P3H15_31965 [Rhodococcus sp. T2V]|uniref:hypothetical protein n=1 Tax=Rhodococcus sp. T2V TaxID=3034164 RepID=UPI0023E25A4B|nr:hypothetical protein [Rhodococcus sp. T2V]MDF3309635.1 hypothetical protein [Rhodococcus sp. T2V]